MRYILCAAVAILILGKSALAQTPQAQSGTKDYLIGPADVLDIKVRYDDSFNTVAFVRPDGKITIKLMADVQAAGLSTMQLADRISQGLKEYYEKGAPLVTVTLLEMKSKTVYIEGRGIAKSGPVSLSGPLNVMQLIAIAGGLTEYAKKKDIKIFRMEGDTARPIPFNYESFTDGSNPKQNIELRPGDVVDVP